MEVRGDCLLCILHLCMQVAIMQATAGIVKWDSGYTLVCVNRVISLPECLIKSGMFMDVKVQQRLVMPPSIRHKLQDVSVFMVTPTLVLCSRKSNLWCHCNADQHTGACLQFHLELLDSLDFQFPAWAALQPYPDESGLVFPAAAVHSEVAHGGCWGVRKKGRGFCAQPP